LFIGFQDTGKRTQLNRASAFLLDLLLFCQANKFIHSFIHLFIHSSTYYNSAI